MRSTTIVPIIQVTALQQGLPASTTWISGAAGDFETASNWNPAFITTAGTDDFGDATIGAGSSVTFQGLVPADLTSLTLAAGSVLTLTTGRLTLEDQTLASLNSGTIIVGGNAQLLIGGTVANIGVLSVAGGTVAVSGSAQLAGTTGTILVGAGGDIAVGPGDSLTVSGTIINNGTVQAAGGTLVLATGAVPMTNAGQLSATLGGTLDLQSNVSNAGGTVAANGGVVELDGMTVTNGLLTSTGSLDVQVVNHATLVGTAPVANGVTTSPTAGLLNTASLLVASGDALTLIGAITNRGLISVTGKGSTNPAATLVVAGSVALSGGGTIALKDSVRATQPQDQLIIAAAAGAILDNFGDTISGYGSLGAGLSQLTLINEAGGTVDAVTTLLYVNTGTNAIINKGLLESTTGVLSLHGSVVNTGGTIAAVGGSTDLLNAIVTGGTFATSAGGVIYAQVSSTLDSAIAAITLATGAIVAVDGASTLTLAGTIANHGTLAVVGDTYDNVTALAHITGTVSLTGGGALSLSSNFGNYTPLYEVVTATAAGAVLDNIDNTVIGYGQLGAGTLTLRNEAAATVEAAGGTLVVNTGSAVVTNHGRFAAIGGTLALQSVVDNTAGGSVVAQDAGGTPGVILLDGGTLRGGTVTTDQTDPASQLTVSSNGGTLDGTAGPVTLAAGAQARAGEGTTLTLKGTLANLGTLGVAGDSFNNAVATIRVAGTATLSGGGTVSLYSLNASPVTADQVITGTTAADKLDNINNTIMGYGQLGGGALTLVNEAAGTIEAIAGGTLVVRTGTNATTNRGLMQAFGGTLAIQGVVDSTAGGTVAALDNGTVTGIVQLDGGTLRGGTLRTDPSDAASMLQLTGNGGTLDGSAGGVTLAAGAMLAVVPGSTLTLLGSIANHGTIAIDGDGYGNNTAKLAVSGSVTLSGAGLLVLADTSTTTNSTATQLVTGTTAAARLDNVDNLISGYGELGVSQLTLVNEAKGAVEATGGTMIVDTGTRTVTNKGLMEAAGGTLLLRGLVDDAGGGTIAALNNATISGVLQLDGATVEGGTIVTDTHDTASILTVTSAGATLDGIPGAVTLASGAQVVVSASDTLTVEGTLTNHGTLSVIGDGYSGQAALLRIAGTVMLNGGGAVVLADASPDSASSTSQVITGVVAGDTLDNVDNTIGGYGSLGAGHLTLINETKGTIAASGGVLVVNTGSVAVANHGMLEAVGGTLLVQGVVNGTAGGTVAAFNRGTVAGVVLLDGGTLRGGTIVTDPANAASALLLTANGGTLDGTAGAVTLAAGAQATVASGQTMTLTGAITELGTLDVLGNGFSGQAAAVRIGGTVILSGGGALVLADTATNTTASATQVITGTAPGATLDNAALIIGYGSLGAGQLALINETKGTIAASGGVLVVNTGSVAVTNHGMLEAIGGTLLVQGVVNGTAGGTVAAFNRGTVAGVVLLDGGTLRGGTIATDLANAASALLLTANGGTLDGTAGAVTLAAGAQATVAAGQTMTLIGAITGQGTLDVLGNGFSGQIASVRIGGTVTLSGGGTIVLTDASAHADAATTQLVTGVSAGATLDNISDTIIGYGEIGATSLSLVNAATGTIDASGGALILDAGPAGSLSNAGLMAALSGTLDVASALINSGVVMANGGLVVLAAAVTGTGQLDLVSTNLLLGGSVAAGQTIQFGAYGTSETLDIANPAMISGTINGFGSGDAIVIEHTALTAVNYQAGSGSQAGTGKLVLIAGTATVGTLTLAGSYYAAPDFLVESASGGASVVTLIPGISSIFQRATASAAVPNPLNFGVHHVGDTLSHALAISNIGSANGLTEGLDASLGAPTGAATASGSFSVLAPSFANGNSLTIGLSSARDGVQMGAGVLTLTSDGSFVDGIGLTPLPAQTIAAVATLFAYAAPILSATTLDFGSTRLGTALPLRLLTIANGTTADAFQENLGYVIVAPPVGFTLTGPMTGQVASGATSAAANFRASAASSGVLAGSAELVALTSLGGGTSGLADTALPGVSVALRAKVYAPAQAGISATSVNFGVVHVGDTILTADTITNTVTGGLTDVLTGGVGTLTPGAFSGSGTLGAGTLGSGLASGAGGIINFGLNTATSGVFTGSATLALASHDPDLADVAVAAGLIALSGTVDNYATAAIQPFLGGGSLSGALAHFTLDLGTIEVGARAATETLDVANLASGLADLLSGSFVVNGSGFINSGFTNNGFTNSGFTNSGFTNSGFGAFSGLGAGQGNSAPVISLYSARAGTFTETITLFASGSNSSGYSADLPQEVLTVSGTVTPQARNLVWTGAADADFANPLNWNDTTSALDPAIVAPGSIDLATFENTGGLITGTGSAAALSFDGGAWNVASDATVTAAGSVTVGTSQASALLISQGAQVTGLAGAVIAAAAGSDGSSVGVTGSGSNWQVGGTLEVGAAAAGSLSITNGGRVTAASLDAGVQATATSEATGQISLSGAGSDLAVTGDVTIGDTGSAALSILNGATVSAADLTIGAQGSGSGAVLVSDAGSVLDLSGTLNVGTALGVGELTIGPNATIIASQVILQGAVVNEGGLLDPNEIDVLPGSPISGYGAIGGTGDLIVNDGTITAASGNKPSQKTMTVMGTITGTGQLVIDAGSTLAVTGPAGSGQSVSFAAGTGALALADPADFHGVITSFAAGDHIVVSTDAPASFSQSGSVVSVIENGTTLGVLTFATAQLAQTAAQTTGALVDNALCFLAGTLITTPTGQLEVERLAAGDLVLTTGGQIRPVVWIGMGRVLAARGRRSAATPVIVRKGALGPNLPHQDLRVTKGHSLLLDGVLIPVEFLVNHRSILWDDRAQEVEIYHVELETHDVLLANGSAAESYRDDGNRFLFQNGNTGWDLPAKPPCVPVLTGGAVVDAVWRRLLERAGKRPAVPLTRDPDLHLLVDGMRVEAATRTDDVAVFHVAAGATVRLVSRAAAPQELGLANDPRCLGVAVRRIAVRQGSRRGTRFQVLHAGDATLAVGFHPFETGPSLHWTDGDATLPQTLFAGFTGTVEVVVHVAATAQYIDDGDAPASAAA